ncbi:RNA polymerase sigma factor [Rudanella lutea]|uniref:RNA polymerase sigma factor n=1 Tax=Rudanella lutea TaxID=451374 RepID=UPI00037D0123|nr:sigma-70 family RNA polymerase sigma factor [Rudanella lutea]
MSIHPDDIQVWQAFQQGDEEAYTSLYRTHIRPMYRYGMSLTPISEAFVLDCIHDVFAEIWIKRNRLGQPENVRFYLLKALKTRMIHLMQRKERPYQPLSQVEFDELWAEPSSEELLSEQQETTNRQELVQKLISQLPPRQQEAVRLRFVEEMDYHEIAQVLDINRQSAQNLVFRAVEKLRKWLLAFILLFLNLFAFVRV